MQRGRSRLGLADIPTSSSKNSTSTRTRRRGRTFHRPNHYTPTTCLVPAMLLKQIHPRNTMSPSILQLESIPSITNLQTPSETSATPLSSVSVFSSDVDVRDDCFEPSNTRFLHQDIKTCRSFRVWDSEHRCDATRTI